VIGDVLGEELLCRVVVPLVEELAREPANYLAVFDSLNNGCSLLDTRFDEIS